MSIFVRMFRGNTLCLSVNDCFNSTECLKCKVGEVEGIPISLFMLSHNGKNVSNDRIVLPGECYQVSLRLQGGKGGFGSMLRMIGAQIDKTTNHDACRDLSGRRMRDVNNEKKLSEWITKKAEMEEERRQNRIAKLERLRQEPRHIFVDPSYDKQKREVIDSLDDAITQGIEASGSTSSSSSRVAPGKRKAEDDDRGLKKRAASTMWMGVDEESDSDDEDETIPVTNQEARDASKQPDEIPPSPGSQDKNSSSCDKQTSEGDQAEDSENKNSAQTQGNKRLLLDMLPVPAADGPGGSCDDSPGAQGSQANPSAPLDLDQGPLDLDQGPLDLDQISAVTELETYGLDALKTALMALGMKCGGNLQQRAERLFSVKGIEPENIDPRLMAKAYKGQKNKDKVNNCNP